MTDTNDRLMVKIGEAIRQAGIPINGLRETAPGVFGIDFRPEATSAQRTQAQTILTNFDRRARRPRSIAALVADINAMTVANRNILLVAVLAQILQRDPQFAIRAGFPALVGDEVDPTDV